MTDEADMTSGSILEVVVPVTSYIEKSSFLVLQKQIEMKKQQLHTKFITESSEFQYSITEGRLPAEEL